MGSCDYTQVEKSLASETMNIQHSTSFLVHPIHPPPSLDQPLTMYIIIASKIMWYVQEGMSDLKDEMRMKFRSTAYTTKLLPTADEMVTTMERIVGLLQ